ncbi:snRNA-activating protein complex subunit 4 [Danio aesculapii]|uniref:snRNA-activating protein complex subunit 4 n=1 Tax=Danio aesculapii TaxID=1142201 RepID=UPI0024BFC83D|nr:snRNA-activating protein complex subunit 4 [Danio aesculapii]
MTHLSRDSWLYTLDVQETYNSFIKVSSCPKMASDDLIAQRDKIQQEILALESTLGADSSIADQLSSDNSSDYESDDSEPTVERVERDDLETERQRIQREIEELENALGADANLENVLQDSDHDTDSSNEDSGDDLELPQNVETCLQMNLVYQEVLKEKLAELEQLLIENQQQQKEIEVQLSGPGNSISSVPGVPPQKQYLGYFLKPYFKDKLTGLGPPANEETKERMKHGSIPVDNLKIKRWEGWQKTLLTNAVARDTMKRMLQPKLSKMEYLSTKLYRVESEEKEQLKRQIELIEKQIAEIRTLKDDQLLGDLQDDHDWDKISNIDFEGLRQADDLKRFWQNFLHPSINKSVWKQDEINKLKAVAEEFKMCHWDKIAEALGTNRTAFMCFQTYQRYISKTFRRIQWTEEEDDLLRELVEKMRIGNFIPYIQMSHFMVGRDGSQLAYRWTSVLDPSLKKGPWSKEEDQLLRNAVAKYGTREWGRIKMEVPGRTDSACRDRYLDCLRETVKKGAWSHAEMELLKEKVAKYGVGKWAKIASEIPNRVDAQCLNKWKLMTRPKKDLKRPLSSIRTRYPKNKRQKLLKTFKEEMFFNSSSEDESQIKYMNSDESDDFAEEENLEIPQKEYVQTEMKEWIPRNATVWAITPGSFRTLWVCLPTNEEVRESTKESGLGSDSSENRVCPNDEPILERNTILDRFGDVERTSVGMKTIVLHSRTDSEKAMFKVCMSDVKQFIQMKATEFSVKKKRKEKNKKRTLRDVFSLNNDLQKAVIPWIGNVIISTPPNEAIFCEGDIVGIKAASIRLQKTSVFKFFIKAFHVDVNGCRTVIEIHKKLGLKMPIAITANPKPTPISTPPKTVAVLLQQSKAASEHKKPTEPSQQPSLPPPQQPSLPRPQQPTLPFPQQPSLPPSQQSFLPSSQQTSLPPSRQPSLPPSQQPSLPPPKQPSLPPPQQPSLPPPQPPSQQPTLPPPQQPSLLHPQQPFLPPPQPPSQQPSLPPPSQKPSQQPSLSPSKRPPQFLPVRQMTTPTLIYPNNLVITQPNIKGAVQHLVFKGLLLPQEPSKAIPHIPLPLMQQKTPAQPIAVSKLPNVIDSNSIKPSKRVCKPTKKAQALMEQSKVKSGKKEPQKQNQGHKNVVFPTVTLQTQPVIKILSPTRLVQVTGLPANISSNQTMNMPDKSLAIKSSQPCSSGNLNQSAPVVVSSPTNPPFVHSSVSNVSKNNLNVSSTLNISPRVSRNALNPASFRNSTIPLVQNISVQQNVQIVPQIPINVVHKATPTKAAKNSSDSSSDESIVKQYQSSPSTGRRISPAVFNILPNPSTPPTLASGPVIFNPNNKVVAAKLCDLNVSSSQLPTVSTQKTKYRPIRPLGPLPVVAPPSRKVTSSSQIRALSVGEPLIPLRDFPAAGVNFDSHLIFPEKSSEVDDWMDGKGGVPLPHLDTSLPYLPPSAATIKTMTDLLRAKQPLLLAAKKVLPAQYQDESNEEAEVEAIRKVVAERFASNPAYLLCKARFLSCFTLPALLATINPCEERQLFSEDDEEDDLLATMNPSEERQSSTEDDEEDLLTNERIQPPTTRTELNMNENEASAKQFSGIGPKRQRNQRIKS